MRHCQFFIVLFLLGAFHVGASTVLFTDSFTLAAGGPQVFDRSFAVNTSDTCDGRARYFITVVTGDSAGKHAISSGVITLNGTTLLREPDFANAPHSITLQITPAATNTLHVELRGGNPGSVLGVAIIREIETPVLARTYAATKGENTLTETVPFDAGAQYALLVQNGASDGTGAVQSVTVRVNGASVLTQQNLRAGRTVTMPVLIPGPSVQLATTLRGNGGSLSLTLVKILDERVCVTFGVTITAPADGATVTSRPLLVRGTVIGGRDLGVAVNGVAAQLDLTHTGLSGDPIPWVAVLKAGPAALTLTATATAPSGLQRAASVGITYAPPRQTAELEAVPASGTAPLDVNFQVHAGPGQHVVKYELDLDGDGTYETVSTTLPQALSHHYDTAGLRIISFRATDDNGQVTSSSVPVEVDSFAAVDAIIQARWSAFRALLAAGKIDDALAFFAGEAEREKYRGPLQLIQPTLPQFAADMATIQPVYIRGGVAYYLLTRSVNSVTQGFPVYFNCGTDGLWKIVQY